MKLNTERLLLRKIKREDLPDLVKNLNDIEVTKWLLTVPYPYALKNAREFFKKTSLAQPVKNRKIYSFNVINKKGKNLLGGADILRVNKNQGTAEICYWIGKEYWNDGYGSEALESILKFGFNRLKLRRISAHVFVGNKRSGRLLEKFWI